MTSAGTTISYRRTLICAAGIAGASLLAAFLALPRLHDYFFVWSSDFGPAVAYACGHGLAEFRSPVPTLVDFLNRSRDDFDCSLIPAATRFGPLGAYANGIPYFLRALGLYWRMAGVSWQALAPAFGAMFAISNTLLFLLFSEYLGTALAGVLALVYVFTPTNYYSLTYYEHYTKTPIFLASVLIMVWLARNRVSFRQLIAASIAGGLLIGVGFGVRADLWLLTVLFVATLIFFTARDLSRRARWLACLVFCVTCTAVAFPALKTQGSSYFWLQLLEGLSSKFNADLSVRGGIYEWIPQYNDNLAFSWIQTHSYFRMSAGTVAAIDGFAGGSSPAPGLMDWQAREAAGMSAYLAIMRHFPADFITRPLAAVAAIFRESFGVQSIYAGQFGTAPNFFTRAGAAWSLLAAVSILPLLAFVADIFGLAVRDRRQAFFSLMLVLYLGGMTAIVFIPRHRWHLYFIGLLVVGIAARFLIQQARLGVRSLKPSGRLVARTFGFVLIVAGLAGTALVVTRAWQDRSVGQLVEQLHAADKEPVRLSRVPAQDTAAVFEATDLIDRFLAQRPTAPFFQYGHYLMATFPGAGCAAARVRVVYRASAPYFDDTRDVALDFRDGSTFFDLIFPAYDMHNGARFAYFRGLEVAGADGCVPRLARFRDPAALPFLITWHLPEHWQAAPRHQTIIFARQ